jgi:hypothetical protein
MRNCKVSWINSYLEYTHEQESPKAFHFWVSMAILSSMVRRNVVIPRVMYRTYPNLFIILVAGSAKCRKSVALSLGESILKSTEEPPMIFSQKITPEALIGALQESTDIHTKVSYGLVLASELSVFLGGDAIKNGMIPILTDLYDSKDNWEYKTKARGTEKIPHVTISMLGASTMDWIKTSIPMEAIGGGFTSRVIFVFEDSPSKLILFSDGKLDNIELRNDLIHDLNNIGKLKGSVVFSPEAKKASQSWYEQEATNIRDPKVDGYFGRKHDTMFKVATLLSIAESDKLLIEEHHIIRALAMLEQNELLLTPTLEAVASSVGGENTNKLLQIIKRFSPIKHSDLLQKCWRYASAEEAGGMLDTLIQSGEIEVELNNKNVRMYKRKEQQ